MTGLTGWTELIAAFIFFIISHRFPIHSAVRPVLVSHLGKRMFTWAYAIVSVLALYWIVRAAGRAPYVELWPFAAWQTWCPAIAMVFVCLIAAFAIGKPNPFSFGGAAHLPFDPSNAGIVAVTRHPILVAIVLWALGHLFPNGDLAHVLIFGGFVVMGVMGMRALDRRKQRELGDDWQRMSDETRVCSTSRWRRAETWKEAVVRVAAAALIYGILFWSHAVVIGVSPLPIH